MNLKRTNFYFPKSTLERLKEASASTGLPMSEIMRRALDEYLERLKEKGN